MSLLANHPHALFILLFLAFGLATAILNAFTIRRFDQYRQATKFPPVSVLVPARNEAQNIETCLSSLLAQDYPDFEVIALDDHSTDATPLILDRLAGENPRLRIMKGTPLPESWLGKHWACHQLQGEAMGEVLLFADADTFHSPSMLRDSVSAMLAEGADMVTAIPHQLVLTWGERLLVPFIGFGILTFIPMSLVRRLRLKMLSVTIGQFMLFKREAFEAVGGFEAVRTQLVDDMCLGRNIIASGHQWRFMDGTRHISCRMYRGFWEAVEGFAKSLFGVFDYRILPYLAGWALVGVVFLEPVFSLLTRWLGYPLGTLTTWEALMAVGLSLVLWWIALRRFGFPSWLVLFYPIIVMLFILVAARSFIQTANGKATWKDRVLDAVAMRWW